MKKFFYPAIFIPEEDGAFTVTFPDLPECITCGESMDEAYEMANDALGLCLSYMKENKEIIPEPSKPQDVSVHEGEYLMIIEFDMGEYLRKHNSKAVKKTLSIPEWLNEEAIAKGVNFSQVLQEALMAKLGIYR